MSKKNEKTERIALINFLEGAENYFEENREALKNYNNGVAKATPLSFYTPYIPARSLIINILIKS